MLQRIFTLIYKELLGVWRDPKSRLSLLLPPLIQLCIFTFAATLDVKNISIAILNRDTGKEGWELAQRFHGSPNFSHIVYLQALEEVAPFLDTQKGVMVLSLPEEFSRDLSRREAAPVQLLLDGRKSNTAQIVVGYTERILEEFNRNYATQHHIPQQPVTLMVRNWYNPNLLYYWYNIPSLVVTLSMLTCLIVTSISIARERELGTFDQLLVSPLRPLEIVIGKIVPGILVGVCEGAMMLTVGIFILGVPFTGSLPLYFFSLVVFIASVSGVGLFLSSLSATQQQAMLGTFMFTVPSVLLSGFATPIENMPAWLQPFTYLIPLRYMLVVSKGMFLKAMPFRIVLTQVWPLAVIAVFTLVGADLFFRRRLE